MEKSLQSSLTSSLHYCAQKVADSGSSFSWSFRILPAEKRLAMNVLYAFCREVDDIVDVVPQNTADVSLHIQTAHKALTQWQENLAKIYQAQSSSKPFSNDISHPIAPALAMAIKQFDWPQEELLMVIEGMMMDIPLSPQVLKTYPLALNLNSPHHFLADRHALARYCEKVAGVVGRLSTRVFGFAPHQTKAILTFATTLGYALQLTNILRDWQEDASLDRLYVPLSDLQKHGLITTSLSPESLLKARHDLVKRLRFGQLSRQEHAQWIAVRQDLMDEAQSAYQSAHQQLMAMPEEKPRQKASLVMGRVYYALLKKMQYEIKKEVIEKGDVESKRAIRPMRLTNWQKMTIGLTTWLLNKDLVDGC